MSAIPPFSMMIPAEDVEALVEHAANLAAQKVEERVWPRYMNTETGARYTSLSVKAITNRCRDRRINARKIAGEWSIARAALDEYMERGKP